MDIEFINSIEEVCAGLHVRIISDCQWVEDGFGEKYYRFGPHFMDLYNIGYDVIEKGLIDRLGNVKVAYDDKHNKIWVKRLWSIFNESQV